MPKRFFVGAEEDEEVKSFRISRGTFADELDEFDKKKREVINYYANIIDNKTKLPSIEENTSINKYLTENHDKLFKYTYTEIEKEKSPLQFLNEDLLSLSINERAKITAKIHTDELPYTEFTFDNDMGTKGLKVGEKTIEVKYQSYNTNNTPTTAKPTDRLKIVDIPKHLEEGQGPLLWELALQLENGRNMPENPKMPPPDKGVLYFKVQYNEDGKVTHISSPPVQFDGDLCYCKVAGKKLYLKVTKHQLEELEAEAMRNSPSKQTEVSPNTPPPPPRKKPEVPPLYSYTKPTPAPPQSTPSKDADKNKYQRKPKEIKVTPEVKKIKIVKGIPKTFPTPEPPSKRKFPKGKSTRKDEPAKVLDNGWMGYKDRSGLAETIDATRKKSLEKSKKIKAKLDEYYAANAQADLKNTLNGKSIDVYFNDEKKQQNKLTEATRNAEDRQATEESKNRMAALSKFENKDTQIDINSSTNKEDKADEIRRGISTRASTINNNRDPGSVSRGVNYIGYSSRLVRDPVTKKWKKEGKGWVK